MKIGIFGWEKKNEKAGKSASEIFAISKGKMAKGIEATFHENEQTVNVVFVDNFEMQMLNNEFRQKDEATDVLSFNIDEGEVLGEVYVSLEFLNEQDRLNENEILRMIVHGILHLLGHDHNSYFGYSENIIGGENIGADKKPVKIEKMFVVQEKLLMNLIGNIQK